MLDRIDHDGALIIGEWKRRQARIAAFDTESVAQHQFADGDVSGACEESNQGIGGSQMPCPFLAPSRSPASNATRTARMYNLATPEYVYSLPIVDRPAETPQAKEHNVGFQEVSDLECSSGFRSRLSPTASSTASKGTTRHWETETISALSTAAIPRSIVLAKPGLVGSKTVVAQPAAALAHDPNGRRPNGTAAVQRGQVPHSG